MLAISFSSGEWPADTPECGSPGIFALRSSFSTASCCLSRPPRTSSTKARSAVPPPRSPPTCNRRRSCPPNSGTLPNARITRYSPIPMPAAFRESGSGQSAPARRFDSLQIVRSRPHLDHGCVPLRNGDWTRRSKRSRKNPEPDWVWGIRLVPSRRQGIPFDPVHPVPASSWACSSEKAKFV